MNNSKNDIDKGLPIFPIGTFSSTLDIHPRTLRIYDKEGILSPSRSEKNRRYYSIRDVEKCKIIQFLTRNLALNLSGVKIILSFLENNKIDVENQLEYIKLMAKNAGITMEEQETNIKKTSKRGRPNKN